MTFLVDVVNEPILFLDLPCGTIYETISDLRRASAGTWTGNSSSASSVRTRRAPGSLSPTGARPAVKISLHANWRDEYAVPGDESSALTTSHGSGFKVSAPGVGVIVHIAGPPCAAALALESAEDLAAPFVEERVEAGLEFLHEADAFGAEGGDVVVDGDAGFLGRRFRRAVDGDRSRDAVGSDAGVAHPPSRRSRTIQIATPPSLVVVKTVPGAESSPGCVRDRVQGIPRGSRPTSLAFGGEERNCGPNGEWQGEGSFADCSDVHGFLRALVAGMSAVT